MFDDELAEAIKRKFAPDIMEALRTARSIDLVAPQRASISIPLRADIGVVYDMNAAAFAVDACVRDTDNESKWLRGRQFFCTRELTMARDKAALVEHLFDHMKRDFLRALVEGELDFILKPKKKDPRHD